MVFAYERAVFNAVLNNRNDHPKNFAYLMSKKGDWKFAPAYDVTFCEVQYRCHQMDIMGEALDIVRTAMLKLAEETEAS